jgi:two-component system, chemotaxis family, CheB/CheR fusion protein
MGGSAGSLKSFEDFFTALPADSGVAFVVIQHLAPAHTSLLPELVAQHTRMKVVQAQEAVPVEPNCVYVIPPNSYLGIRDGVLYLTEPIKHDGIRMPIDFFFRSLAEDRQQRAVGILFSGAGSDGTLGVRAIRGGGGLTIAQDPSTAQFDSMPRSAIATGLVDYVLPPNRMPEALLEYLGHPYVRGGEPAAVLEAEGKPGGVQDILALVLAQTGCDFRCYKKSTILRRIERRMGLHHISDVAVYHTLLSKDTREVGELLKDLLINVTSFFRDAEAFEELRQKVIRPLVEAKQTGEPLRAWVPGCASGEEAYSLAILLMEEVAAAPKNCDIQVFATDIDADALKFARQGVYPESIVADVEAGRLSRFFVRQDAGYHISDALRKSVVFAAQNLIRDPPFSKMDIISCRNLLIYLDADTQTRLMPLFNFALNPGGYLFLGKSEGIGGRSDLFDIVSKKARLYRRLTPARPIALDTPVFPGRTKMTLSGAPAALRPPAAAFTDLIGQTLLSHFSASLVLVDRRGQILQFHGQTGKYLNMPTGEPRLNLLDMARKGLSLKLRAAMHKAIEDGKPVVLESVSVVSDESSSFVRVTVVPVVQRGEAEPLLAVIFEDVPRPATADVELAQSGQSETAVRQLEDELQAAQHDLQFTIDDLQASNEELRVANEEVISGNEELQSTNEELETSKEELQSVNEELVTVNSQLQEKVHQLDAANSDMANLLKSPEIAAIFLDNKLRIKFFTPAITRVLNLIAADMGRPLTHLSMDLIGRDLAADARAVTQGASVVEKEVQHTDGSSYLMRAVPYRTQMNRVDGVVITFIDVSNLRRTERQLADVAESSADAIFVKSLEGTILTWNPAAEAVYGYPATEAIGSNVSMLIPPDRMSELAGVMEKIKRGQSITAFETERVRKDGRALQVSLSLSPMRDDSRQIVGVSTVTRDITERIRLEQHRRAAFYTRSLIEVSLDPLVTIGPDGKVTDVNKATEEATGAPRERLIGTDFAVYFTDPAEASRGYRKVLSDGEVRDYALTIRHVSGRTMDVLYNASVYHDEAGQLLGVFAAARDVTERKRAEAELKKHQLHLEALVEERTAELQKVAEDLARSNRDLQQFAAVASHDLQEPLRTVSGFVQLLQKKYADQLDAEADTFIGHAVDGAKRMEILIKDLLAYARVDSRRREPSPTDANLALRQALDNLGDRIQETRAEITHGKLPTVRTDPSQLAQLFQNLLGNAMKFHAEAPPKIHVDACREGDYWRFSVSDNGIGIASEYQDHIFEVFRRLHSRAQYAGTGIGLAICKKIVERHGGRIWVESEPGHGSTFHFILPT